MIPTPNAAAVDGKRAARRGAYANGVKGGDGQAADGNSQAVTEERILPLLTGSPLSSPTKVINAKGRFCDGVVGSVMPFGQGRCAQLHKWLSVEGCAWHVLLAVHGNAASVQLVVPICPGAGIRRVDTPSRRVHYVRLSSRWPFTSGFSTQALPTPRTDRCGHPTL